MRGKRERLMVHQNGVEVEVLRVHATCLLPAADATALQAYAKDRGETYAALTSRLLREAVEAILAEVRAAAAARGAAAKTAAARIPELEAARREVREERERQRRRLKDLNAELGAAKRTIARGGA